MQKEDLGNIPSYISSSVRRDIEMLELLAVATKEAVCLKLRVTMGTLDARLYRARIRKRESRWHVNKLESLERRNPRLRKIMLSANEKDEDLIDDLNEIE